MKTIDEQILELKKQESILWDSVQEQNMKASDASAKWQLCKNELSRLIKSSGQNQAAENK